MSREGVLCAGTILVDVAKVIDAYPALDHLATIEEVSLSTGGPGLNMAVDLRMLGAAFPIGVLGAVGDDEHGAFIMAECARLDIEVAGVRKLAGAVTSFTDGMIERDGGRRTFFHHSGANALFDASAADLGLARILHAGAPGIHPVMDGPQPGGATAGPPCSSGPRPRACIPTWKWSAWHRTAPPKSPGPACPTWTAS